MRPIRAANMASKQGQITEATADHYVIKTSANEVLRINFNEHTRIIGGTVTPTAAQGRFAPGNVVSGPVSASDILVGDYITTVGELVETDHNAINAALISKLDPERVKEMKTREAEFGKSWLAGRITAITGTTITINGMIDSAPHNVVVDENTSLTQRHDPATLADLHVGDMIRVDGTGTPGSDFHATKIMTGGGRMMGGLGGMGPSNGSGGAPARIPNDVPAPAPQQAPATPVPATTPQ
jgi:hypothetical protein